jgi:hypothetical protein
VAWVAVDTLESSSARKRSAVDSFVRGVQLHNFVARHGPVFDTSTESFTIPSAATFALSAIAFSYANDV